MLSLNSKHNSYFYTGALAEGIKRVASTHYSHLMVWQKSNDRV